MSTEKNARYPAIIAHAETSTGISHFTTPSELWPCGG